VSGDVEGVGSGPDERAPIRWGFQWAWGQGSGGELAFGRQASGRLIDGSIGRETTGLATTALRLVWVWDVDPG